MQPLVSILIPAYQAQEWIGDTLRSALAQTWRRKEIIVVDDGSQDGTLAVARQFESTIVKVVAQDNQGAAAARNKAFSICQGDYIQWLDADDLLSPQKISYQIATLDIPPNKRILLSSPWGQFLHRYYRARFIPNALWADLSPGEWLLRKLENNLHMQTATWLVSRELTEAAGPWNTQLLVDDDGEYFCRVLLASEGVRFVPESRVYYRASGSTSLSYIGWSDNKMDAQLRSMELTIRYLRSIDNSGRAHRACVQYLQDWLFYFYPERPDLIGEAQALAASLGGELAPPTLSWKYAWADALLGRRAVKRAQILIPNMKWRFLRQLDKVLLRVDGRVSLDSRDPLRRGS